MVEVGKMRHDATKVSSNSDKLFSICKVCHSMSNWNFQNDSYKQTL